MICRVTPSEWDLVFLDREQDFYKRYQDPLPILPPDRTICKILNFWELFSSERVATQLKVLHKQHMLDV